jgi:hypothetical protein
MLSIMARRSFSRRCWGPDQHEIKQHDHDAQPAEHEQGRLPLLPAATARQPHRNNLQTAPHIESPFFLFT